MNTDFVLRGIEKTCVSAMGKYCALEVGKELPVTSAHLFAFSILSYGLITNILKIGNSFVSTINFRLITLN